MLTITRLRFSLDWNIVCENDPIANVINFIISPVPPNSDRFMCSKCCSLDDYNGIRAPEGSRESRAAPECSAFRMSICQLADGSQIVSPRFDILGSFFINITT
jgi:hypothetical protein